MRDAEPPMTDLEIESLDYKLSRLSVGKSTCIKAGEWAYLATDGSLHRLSNQGYYFAWKCDMWGSSTWFWNEKRSTHPSIKPYGWSMGEISYGKGALIGVIESKIKKAQADGRNGAYPAWERGFGRMPENTPKHWEVMA